MITSETTPLPTEPSTSITTMRPPNYVLNPQTPKELVDEWYANQPFSPPKPDINRQPYPGIWGK